jgi:putative protease
MKIPRLNAPFRTLEQIESVVAAGADELYCGYLDRQWVAKYGAVCSSNRREWAYASIDTPEKLGEAVRTAHLSGRPLSIALNTSYYPLQTYPDIMRHVEAALAAGADSLIIADLALVAHLRESGISIPITASTGMGILNHEYANFLAGFGVTRVVLERQLTPPEIAATRAGTALQLEAFILFRRCINVDGFCTFHHGTDVLGLGDVGCRFPYTYTLRSLPTARSGRTRRNMARHAAAYAADPEGWGLMSSDLFECGLCALWHMANVGVDCVKVVGRAVPFFDAIPTGIAAVRRFLDLLKADPGMGRDPFFDVVRRFVQTELPAPLARPCAPANCYYPYVMEEKPL